MFETLIWIVPLAVAALGIWRPRAGLVALAAALPLFGSPPGGPYLAALDAAALAAIATCWRTGRPRPSPLAWPALAWLCVGLASLVPSPYLPPSWAPGMLLRLAEALTGVESWTALYTWRAAADLLLGWGLFVAVRRAFGGHSLRPLAAGFLAGLCVTVLFAFAADSGLLDLGAYRPQFGSGETEPRLASIFFLSGWLSQYLVLATPLALVALSGLPGRWRLSAPVVLALSLGCLALTRQRGSWLAATAQLAFGGGWLLLLWRRRGAAGTEIRRVLYAAAAILVVVGIVVVVAGDVGHVVDRAASISGGPKARLPLWQAAVEMFRQRPLLGWGIGSFAPVFDLLNPPGTPLARANHGTAHNLYLHTAAETGVPGLAALAFLAWGAAACLRRPRRGGEVTALALAVSLLGVAVYGVVQQMFFLRTLGWTIWLLLGCAAVVGESAPPGRLAKWARVLALAALALVPLRLAFVERLPLAGDRSFGLHELEGTWTQRQEPLRWTEGFAAVRLPAPGDSLSLYLANGHPLGGARPVFVEVGVGGGQPVASSITGGWEKQTFEVPPESRGGTVLLTIEAWPTFRPFSDFRAYPDFGPSTDVRRLGVAVKLPGDPAPRPRQSRAGGRPRSRAPASH